MISGVLNKKIIFYMIKEFSYIFIQSTKTTKLSRKMLFHTSSRSNYKKICFELLKICFELLKIYFELLKICFELLKYYPQAA